MTPTERQNLMARLKLAQLARRYQRENIVAGAEALSDEELEARVAECEKAAMGPGKSNAKWRR